MKRWLPVIFIALFIVASAVSVSGRPLNDSLMQTNIIEASQKLLLAAKRHENTDSLVAVFCQIPVMALHQQLPDDNHKKAFWINIYNAYTQVLLAGNPERYQNRNAFFGSREINIAGKMLSLDDIEHGILRRSKIKWSLGYLNKWFPSAFEKKNRVDTLDYRLHFTLNCGAKSCPPIAFYMPEKIDKEMDIATKTYLSGESEYKEKDNTIYLPAMMSWFRADFGGKKNMLKLLQQLQIVPAGKHPTIKFKKYDWNLFLENYKTTTNG